MVKELIKNEKTRLATYNRRKASVLKKAWELTTLCGIEAGVIIYVPKRDYQPVQPETWVSEGCELTDVIKKFKEWSTNQCKNYSATNLNQKEEEAAGNFKPTIKINEDNYTTWDERLNWLPEDQLKVVLDRLESKLGDALTRLNMMRGEDRTAVNYQELVYDHQLARKFDHAAPTDSGLRMTNYGNLGYYSGAASSSGGNVQQGTATNGNLLASGIIPIINIR